MDGDDFARNLAHKLAAASVGCVAAGAKSQDCDAGAIGAAVGEMVGDYLIKPSQEIVLDDGSVLAVLTENDIKSVLGQNSSLLRSGKINGQIEGLYNGKKYVLGLRDGVVGQFYPK